MIARYIKLGTAVASLAALVVVDVMALPMSVAVAGLLGALVHRYLLPGPAAGDSTGGSRP